MFPKGNDVAAKVLCQKTSDEMLNAEKRAASLHHSNIVRILGCESGRTLTLVTMELCGPSLQDLIEERELKPKERVSFWSDIARALKYCHLFGIVHADVKPRNIFLSSEGKAKLGDFGNSVMINDEKDKTETTILKVRFGRPHKP